MKCVRVVGQGVPVRMPDAEAFALVHIMGDGDYCPKKLWREWYDGNEHYEAQGGRAKCGYFSLKQTDLEWLRGQPRGRAWMKEHGYA